MKVLNYEIKEVIMFSLSDLFFVTDQENCYFYTKRLENKEYSILGIIIDGKVVERAYFSRMLKKCAFDFKAVMNVMIKEMIKKIENGEKYFKKLGNGFFESINNSPKFPKNEWENKDFYDYFL